MGRLRPSATYPLQGAGLSAATDDLVDELRAAAGTSELLEHCRREVVHLEARDAIAPALALHVALELRLVRELEVGRVLAVPRRLVLVHLPSRASRQGSGRRAAGEWGWRGRGGEGKAAAGGPGGVGSQTWRRCASLRLKLIFCRFMWPSSSAPWHEKSVMLPLMSLPTRVSAAPPPLPPMP